MSIVSRYNRWIEELSGETKYNPKNKRANRNMQISYMLDRLLSMFEYENLPDTIPDDMLELYLLINGNCVAADYKDSLYVYTGGLGGLLDEYYRPTIYTVANPYQNFERNLKIGEECILVRNDTLMIGIMPMLEKYGYHITETELSLNVANINSRLISLIIASNDSDNKAAQEYIQKVIDGDLSSMMSKAFEDKIGVSPYATTNSSNIIKSLIELRQYWQATQYLELGLRNNENMKREALNSSETSINDDILLPLIDNMERNRKKGIAAINAKYGTNIIVKRNSAWKDVEEEIKEDKGNEEDKIE